MKHGRFNYRNTAITMIVALLVAGAASVSAKQAASEPENPPPGARDESTESICDVAARYATEGKLHDLVVDNADGVLTKDGPEDLSIEYEGTAHVPTLIAHRAGTTDSAPYGGPALPPGSDDFWGNDKLGLFEFRDLVYILHYRDMTHPVSMIAVTPSASLNLCRFISRTKLTVPITAVEPAIYKDLIDGHHPPFIVFSRHSPITGQYFPDPPESTQIGSTMTVDAFNDGRPSHLAEAERTSTAGAGCDTRYIELLNAKETAVKSGPRRDLLVALQDGAGRGCGSETQLFAANGKGYAETTSVANELIHRVTRIDSGTVVEVCNFEFKTQISAESETSHTESKKADDTDQFSH